MQFHGVKFYLGNSSLRLIISSVDEQNMHNVLKLDKNQKILELTFAAAVFEISWPLISHTFPA